MISIPVSFLVVLPGDYNLNAIVDGADYVLWRNSDGQSVASGTGDGDRSGTIGTAITQRGARTSDKRPAGRRGVHSGRAGTFALELTLLGVCLCARRRTTLRTWTRKS